MSPYIYNYIIYYLYIHSILLNVAAEAVSYFIDLMQHMLNLHLLYIYIYSTITYPTYPYS